MAEDDTDKIPELFEEYADAMNDMDADTIANLFAYPVTIWQMGKGYVFDDPEELTENVEKLLDAYDDAGVIYSEAEVGPVHVTGVSAFAKVAWRQQDESGDIIHAFHCDYLLVHADGDWFIATIVNKEPSDDPIGGGFN